MLPSPIGVALNPLPAPGRTGAYTHSNMAEFEDRLALAEAGDVAARDETEAVRRHRLAAEQGMQCTG